MYTHPEFDSKTTGKEVVTAFGNEQVKGKTFVITGPSEGTIGGETAVSLAHGSPKHMILAGRSEKKISPVIQRIKEISPSTKVDFVQLDLSEPKAVVTAAKTVASLTDRIDALLNNAGIMCLKDYTTNSLGIELQFATNHLGHFVFTNELLPQIIKAKGRVVNTSSNGYGVSPVLFDDPSFANGKTYHPWIAYGQSKTANILFTLSLADRLKEQGVASFALNPGLILESHLQDAVTPDMFAQGVALYTEVYGARGRDVPTLDPPKPLAAAAGTTLVALLDPAIRDRSGGFISDCKFRDDLEDYATDAKQAEQLWELSEKLVGKKY
ncbi:uncharacterized protein HMPREF1541_07079 [Cyphellophora europaea CBS 101466]|uniref:Uncharacterized protein n=1 Tax=Cyphellophora europaea (strain CBS 101466) TaxID=1220924 RepID=W2RRF1_CYPE1|nr:uncharacterized protein HMPREF1541_07079 [Cyphellophora europaea CBS 101466]ETN39037.1 hypothetical protein HMPREF1541_07079 [Cyphellophora europaea CBS 101466]